MLGEANNSTYAEDFAKAHPERYFEMYIAEQQMVAAAVGLWSRGWTPYASTFACFLTRAYDFVRMARISGGTPRLCGSHAEVSREGWLADGGWRPWRLGDLAPPTSGRPGGTPHNMLNTVIELTHGRLLLARDFLLAYKRR